MSAGRIRPTNDVGTRFLPDDYVIGEKSGPYVICRHAAICTWVKSLSEVVQWIPEPFNLLEGNPFEYSEHAISSISGTSPLFS